MQLAQPSSCVQVSRLRNQIGMPFTGKPENLVSGNEKRLRSESKQRNQWSDNPGAEARQTRRVVIPQGSQYLGDGAPSSGLDRAISEAREALSRQEAGKSIAKTGMCLTDINEAWAHASISKADAISLLARQLGEPGRHDFRSRDSSNEHACWPETGRPELFKSLSNRRRDMRSDDRARANP